MEVDAHFTFPPWIKLVEAEEAAEDHVPSCACVCVFP